MFPRLARKIRASKCAGYNMSNAVAMVANRSRSVLDAEVYAEGTVNDQTERSDVVPGLTKIGSETVYVGKSGNWRDRLKPRRGGVICLGS